MARGRTNWASNETRTHSCRFVSQTWKTITSREVPKIMHIRRIRQEGHCWSSKDQLIIDVFLWLPAHGHTRVGRSAKTYIYKFYTDGGYRLENLTRTMDDRDGWGIKRICAVGVPRWWQWYFHKFTLTCYSSSTLPSIHTSKCIKAKPKAIRHQFTNTYILAPVTFIKVIDSR